MEAWDKARCEELKTLRLLLQEVRDIDNGNRCLDRIARCIQMADSLCAFDLNSGRRNFIDFLTCVAIDGRVADATKKE